MSKGGGVEAHPYAFHVSGPRNVSSSWRELISSSWKDDNYKRSVMACFVNGVYLVELDRQENKTKDNALAPKWWLTFKYKLVQNLTDERDGSVFGAILEWDGFIFMKPSSAPRAVLALRGTLLSRHTRRRDLHDDLRFLTWESLKGSVRFKVALEALKSVSNKYGSENVCIAGHSLGAGFALQIGKALAEQGVFVEAHLFNPPSVSIARKLRNIGEKVGVVWKMFRSILPSGSEIITEAKAGVINAAKWGPHLYVNISDYICCYHTYKVVKNLSSSAKLFLVSKGNQKFTEAHSLDQWWAQDLELQSSSSSLQADSPSLRITSSKDKATKNGF